MTAFSWKTHLPIIRETNEIGECEDQDENIDSFKYKKKTTTNCYEVSTNDEKLKMCRKKKVKKHCSKTCASCVDEPISSGKYFSFFSIKSSSANWNECDAFSEVEMDLERFGSFLFSEKAQEEEEKHKQFFNDYQITRLKNPVKKVSYQCKVLAELLQKIPDVSDTLREKFYVKMIKIASMINATYMETAFMVLLLPRQGLVYYGPLVRLVG